MTLALSFLAPAAAASEPAYTVAPGSPQSSSFSAWDGGSGLAFSPTGGLLARGTAISSVSASGAVTPVGGLPPDTSATAVAFSPSGALLAAADEGAKSISIFSVSPSGALSLVPGSPVALGASPASVVFSPSGELLAVTAGKEEAQFLYVFSVGASGALTPVLGSPYSVSSSPYVAFSPTGSLLAVQLKTGVRMFSVASSGALTEAPGSPLTVSEKLPKGVGFQSNGNLLTSFIGEGGEVITTYSVSSSGALTRLASGVANKDPQGGDRTAFSPDGSRLASPVMDSSYAQVFSVSTSGSVSALSGSPYTTGPFGSNIAFSPNGMLALGGSVFVPSSTSASTNWAGAFGSEGYDLAGWNGGSDLTSLPNASVSLVKGTRCLWAANTTDLRALPSPNGPTRNAAAYCNPEHDEVGNPRLGQTEVKLTFTKAYTGSLRVYSVLWEPGLTEEGKPHESITVGDESVPIENNPDMGNGSFSAGTWALFPVSVPAGGSLTISGELISGIFLGESGLPSGMAFSNPLEGAWTGVVGSEGYDLADWDGAGDVRDMPGVTTTLLQGSPYVWASRSEDPRALQSPDGLQRAAATYFDPNEVQLKLSFASEYKGELHLYAVDWDSNARGETIAVNGSSFVLRRFNRGDWINLPISVAAGGTVTITATHEVGANAVLSGIFLGGAGPPPSPTVTSAPEGNWVGTFGHEGYDLAGFDGPIGDISYLPHASLNVEQASRYQWAQITSDARALYDPTEQIRNAATYFNPNQIKLKLSFPEAYKGTLHLYAVDWDSAARREIITVNNQSAALGEFNRGAWVSFPIEVAAGGAVTIIVDRTAGANAVLSGIFLGEGGAPPSPTVASSVKGSWVGSYGSAGYDLAAWNGSSDLLSLSGATLSLIQGSRYVWSPETSEVRALQAPSGSMRKAATYFDPNELRLALSFSGAYKGELHLYALDWDSTVRRELITVDGQTASLSSEFNQGAWVSFPISVAAGETVSIVVDRAAGANAVLSGIFLG